MFFPLGITGSLGGDIGLFVEEIIPEILGEDTTPAAQTDVYMACGTAEFCEEPAEYTCEDGNVYCKNHLPEGVACWRFS